MGFGLPTKTKAKIKGKPAPKPSSQSGGTSGKLSVKKIPKTPVVTTKGKTISMAGEKAVTVPTRSGRKAVVRSKAVKVSGKYFTPKQAKVLKSLGKEKSKTGGSSLDRAFGPDEQISFKQAAALAEREGLPGITYAQIAQGESNLRPGVPNPDDGYPSLWQMTPSVQSEATKSKWDAIASKRKGGPTNPFVAAEQAKVLAGSGTGTSNYYGTGFVTDDNAHLPGGKAQAKRILNDKPVKSKKTKKLIRKAAKLGVKKKTAKAVTGGTRAPAPKARRVPKIVKIGKIAQRKFGLEVGEHPRFGGVAPVHSPNSFHDTGEAIDVTGDPATLLKFNSFMAKRYGSGLAEMFHDPGINIDNGASTSAIGGHGSHVHVAIDSPGARASAVAGGGAASGSLPAGAISSYAGATGQSTKQVKKKLRSKKLTGQQILAKLEGLGVGTSEDKPSAGADADLAALERKYGSS